MQNESRVKQAAKPAGLGPGSAASLGVGAGFVETFQAFDRPFPHRVDVLEHAAVFTAVFRSAHLDRDVGALIRSRHLCLMGLSAAAWGAVMPAMGTKFARGHLGGTIKGAKIRTQSAREEAQKAAPVPRRKHVGLDGTLRRARTAVADHRAMPQRWLGWLDGRVHRCKTRASLRFAKELA
jgi:hypothetical protein